MTPKEKLLNDIYQYRRTTILLSAASEGLFEHFIERGTLSANEIAEELGWSLRGGEIVLNALCSLGYLQKQNGKYRISAEYEQLFTAQDYPLLKQWLLHEWRLLNRWTHLPEVLKTGDPYREPEKITIHRNHRNFILSMAQREKENLAVMLAGISLDGCKHLLDLGGGPGLFAIGFAEKYPELQATIFDAPETEPIAREFILASPAKNRLRFLGGDFLTDNLGSGYDAALLSSILHIYSAQENRALLQRVYDSLEEGGKIIIRDFFLNRDKTGPLVGTLFAVNMLVNTERGNSYSLQEMKDWLRKAGFRKSRKIQLKGKMALLEAVK